MQPFIQQVQQEVSAQEVSTTSHAMVDTEGMGLPTVSEPSASTAATTGEQKAWAVTEVGAGTTGLLFLGAALALDPVTTPLGVALLVAGLYGTTFTLGALAYTAEHGQEATPEGAAKEGAGGWFCQEFGC